VPINGNPNGSLQPTTIGTGTFDGLNCAGVCPIAIDSASVYWGGGQGQMGPGILQAPLGGGSENYLVAVGDFDVGLSSNGTSVYWADSASIWSMPVGGGTAPTALTNSFETQGMVIDTTNIYWTAGPVLQMPLAGGTVLNITPNTNVGIASVPIGGGTMTTLVSVSGGIYANALAVDASNVYWTGYAGPGTGQIGVYKVPVGGGTPQLVWPGTNPGGIALDSQSIYWTDGTINKIAK
jgi:hypothetical protein